MIEFEGKKFLTTRETAEFMGVSVSMVQKWSFKRALPTYKPFGKILYFCVDDLKRRMFESRTMSATEIEQRAVEMSNNKKSTSKNNERKFRKCFAQSCRNRTESR